MNQDIDSMQAARTAEREADAAGSTPSTGEVADVGLAANAPIEPLAEDGGEPTEIAPGLPRPARVPAKFWDARLGEVRVDALLKSYAELERKLAAMLPRPTGPEDAVGRRRLELALGMPNTVEEYEPCLRAAGFEPDRAINDRLHQAGFTCEQAALVYELAGEHLEPMIAELEAERQTQRLCEHFGGEKQWKDACRQLKTWAEANLEPEVIDALSRSAAGVLAIRNMMRAAEPNLIADGGEQAADAEAELHAKMRDPRYWRDKDPAFVAQVTKGFERLYAKS